MVRPKMATVYVEIADLPQVKAAMEAAAEAIERRDQALYTAWTIIANAYVNASPGPETGWAAAPAEWREAAERWRDEQFHPLLPVVEQVAEAGQTGPLPPVPESAYPQEAVELAVTEFVTEFTATISGDESLQPHIANDGQRCAPDEGVGC